MMKIRVPTGQLRMPAPYHDLISQTRLCVGYLRSARTCVVPLP
jgi:hypothetical protein